MKWKPPSIIEREHHLLRHYELFTDKEKIAEFENCVAAAFRRGYRMRKADERKMRVKADERSGDELTVMMEEKHGIFMAQAQAEIRLLRQNAAAKTFEMVSVSPRAAEVMAGHLEHMAAALRAGAAVVRGGLIVNGPLHLSGDIQLGEPKA